MSETTVALLVAFLVINAGAGLIAAAHAGRGDRVVPGRDRWTTVMVLLGASLYGLGLPAAAAYARASRRSAGRATAVDAVRGIPSLIGNARRAQRHAWRAVRASAER